MTAGELTYLARDPACQWTLLLAVIAFGFCAFQVRKDMGWLAGVTMLYIIWNAMYVWVWSLNRYYPVTPYDQQALRFHAADSILKLLLFLLPVTLVSLRRLDYWGGLLWIGFTLTNAYLVIFEYYKNMCQEVNVCGAIVGNPSMAASFMACALPLLVRYGRAGWLLAIQVFIAIVLTKSSIGLGLVSLFLSMRLVTYFRLSLKAWRLSFSMKPFFFSPLVAVPLVAGYFTLGKTELFNNSTRFQNWKVMMHAWDTPWNRTYGTGFGTFPVMSLNIKRFIEQKLKLPTNPDWFYTMHNDWIENLFTTGLVGSCLMLCLYLLALWHLWREGAKEGFQALVLYGAFMALNYPQHNAWTAAYGLWLLAVALKERPALQLPCCLAYWRQKLYRIRRCAT